MVNTADCRKIPQDAGKEVAKMLRQLRDANKSDWIIRKRCNDMIAMIKNLRNMEEREYKGPGDEEAAKFVRGHLADGMKWLAKWAQDRAQQP